MADEKPVQEIAADNTVVINGVAYERKNQLKNMPNGVQKQMAYFCKMAQNVETMGKEAAAIEYILNMDKLEKAYTALCLFTIGEENFKKLPPFDDLDSAQTTKIMFAMLGL